ncbi:hypothetical protein POM88_019526 [Heracleum sosnowskyi]|uniref:Uncharacterized protein n=1 Tax=Heracleum sosnowskyi TaxID=360622 RepID=A0AAD8IB33_9APIA|nr:hypothetical protein POM88_019526 [Heracleum sosnowskyi]
MLPPAEVLPEDSALAVLQSLQFHWSYVYVSTIQAIRSQDQLARLSCSVFICTVMGDFEAMNRKNLLMNIMALGILVITAVVNICIQLGTGVICEAAVVLWSGIDIHHKCLDVDLAMAHKESEKSTLLFLLRLPSAG